MSTIFKIEETSNIGFGKSFSKLLKENISQSTWLALGSGNSDWYQTYTDVSKQFNILDLVETGGKNITNVIVKPLIGAAYNEGIDYEIHAETGIIERLPNSLIPPEGNVLVSYIDTFETPDTESELLNEKIRRLPFEISYVERNDETGEITLQDRPVTEKWKRVSNPTAQIYIRFVFEQGDIPSETIREMGLFVFGTRKDTVDPAQKFLIPSEILDKGFLIINRRQEPKERAPDTQEYIDFLLEF